MQLEEGVWLAGPYFIDFDALGQLRIAGPGNHLFYASVGLYKTDFKNIHVDTLHNQVKLSATLKATNIFWPDPAMGHIRKIRHLVERSNRAKPNFALVRKESAGEIDPREISSQTVRGKRTIIYRRRYGKLWYGTKLIFPAGTILNRDKRKMGFSVTSPDGGLQFELITETNIKIGPGIKRAVKTEHFDYETFGALASSVKRLAERAVAETDYLVKYNKTSGFEYGTVFPRDWLEAIDLGETSLLPSAKAYMFHKALDLVGAEGEAWHENIVGEFAHERSRATHELADDLGDLVGDSDSLAVALKGAVNQLDDAQILRNMIDIEPHSILSFARIGTDKLPHRDIALLGRVAEYVLNQARDRSLITFKELPSLLRRYKSEEYYRVGNWRDSRAAFKQIHSVVAPFDVNAVFYPQALRQIKRSGKLLGLNANDLSDIDELIDKWSRVKSWYGFTNRDGLSAYALALYDVKETGTDKPRFKQLHVNHLDEAYDLFFGQPSEQALESFCRRLLSPAYFFTKSGPTIVGARDGYQTTDYHGQVIWTKQTAYCVAGLEHQLGRKSHSAGLRALIKEALQQTAQSSLMAYLQLGGTPELHYDLRGHPRFYSDQPTTEGPMNKVQLWSAVGALRIIQVYRAEASLN